MKFAYLGVLILSMSTLEARERETDSSIRFEFVANTSLVLIPVYVNGRGPYRFVLDTGASLSVLSDKVARKLEIPRGPKTRLALVGGAVAGTVRTLQVLQVGPVRIDRPLIAVADLPVLERLHADGILGSDHLKSFNLLIDYGHRIIRID